MKRALRILLLTLLLGVAVAAGAVAWQLREQHESFYTDGETRTPLESAAPRDVMWRPIEMLPLTVNGGGDDGDPAIAPDGLTLVFVRGVPGRNTDLFMTVRTPAGWSEAVPVPGLTTLADELGPAFSRDGAWLYFASDRGGGMGGYDVWRVPRTADGFGTPENVAAINSAWHEYGPGPADGGLVYFSSNRPDDPALVEVDPAASVSEINARMASLDFDLYAVDVRADDTQATAVEALNTDANEAAPAVSPAGDFIYFASDGEGGAGGFDLYRARRLDTGFGVAQNLGAPVNGPGDETEPTIGESGFGIYFARRGADSPDAAPTAFDIGLALSREVFLETTSYRARIDLLGLWSRVWPLLLAALLLLLLVLALAHLMRRAPERLGAASLLARCILASLVIHMLLMLLLTIVEVTTTLADMLAPAGGQKVVLVSSSVGREDLATQLRGALTDLPEQAVEMQASARSQTTMPLQPATALTALTVVRSDTSEAAEPLATATSDDAPARPEETSEPSPTSPAVEALASVDAPQAPQRESAAEASPDRAAEAVESMSVARTDAQPAMTKSDQSVESTAAPSAAGAERILEQPDMTESTVPTEAPALSETALTSASTTEPVDARADVPAPVRRSNAAETGMAVEATIAEPVRRTTASAPARQAPETSVDVAPAATSAVNDTALAATAVATAAPTTADTGTAVPATDATHVATANTSVEAPDVPAMPSRARGAESRAAVAITVAAAAQQDLTPAARAGGAPEIAVAPVATAAPAVALLDEAPDARDVPVTALAAGAPRSIEAPPTVVTGDVTTPDAVASTAIEEPGVAIVARAATSERRDAQATTSQTGGAMSIDVPPASSSARNESVLAQMRTREAAPSGTGSAPRLPDVSGAIVMSALATPESTIEVAQVAGAGESPVDPAAAVSVMPARRATAQRAATPEARAGTELAPTAVGSAMTDTSSLARAAAAKTVETEAPTDDVPDPAFDVATLAVATPSLPVAADIGAAQQVATAPAMRVATSERSSRAVPMDAPATDANAARLDPSIRTPGSAATQFASIDAADVTSSIALPESGLDADIDIPFELSALVVEVDAPAGAEPVDDAAALAVVPPPALAAMASSAPRGSTPAPDPAPFGLTDARLPASASTVLDERLVERPKQRDARVERGGGALLASPVAPALVMLQVAVPELQTSRPSTYVQRDPEVRQEMVERFGGSEETEAAVELSLAWLARQQEPSGRWNSRDFEDTCPGCGGGAKVNCDIAATGLSLLCFLAANHDHMQDGPYRDTVARGLRWLIEEQEPYGSLIGEESMYSHGIAVIALAEAYGMTEDPALAEPVQRAVDFTYGARNRQVGGWRYGPGQAGDTSVMGWQIMAFASAEHAGAAVPQDAYQVGADWLRKVSRRNSPGLYSYQPGRRMTAAMTAEGLFVQQLIGADREAVHMKEAAEFLLEHPPSWTDDANAYAWYYMTMALFQYGGSDWKAWNELIMPVVLEHQITNGPAAGSWEPDGRWAAVGGRIYQTAMCTLILEVYYRYLPSYLQAGDG